MATVTIEELTGLVGQKVGVSDWKHVDQQRIDAFAACTDDHQFIHIDPERAAKTPFGGTIAHGFLTLSLLSALAESTMLTLEGVVMGINYGFEKIRFVQPVRSGRNIRGHFTLKSAEDKGQGRWLMTYDVTVEIEGEEKPALIAEWLGMQVVGA